MSLLLMLQGFFHRIQTWSTSRDDPLLFLLFPLIYRYECGGEQGNIGGVKEREGVTAAATLVVVMVQCCCSRAVDPSTLLALLVRGRTSAALLFTPSDR